NRKTMMTSSKEEEPAKRSRVTKFFLGCFGFFLLLLFLLTIAGFIAFKSLKKPVDLKIDYSYAHFQDFIEKTGLELEGKDEQFCFNCLVEYSGQAEVDFWLSSQEATAWFETVNAQLGPITGTQVKIEEDQVSFSSIFSYQNIEYPVFVVGSIEKTGDRSVVINLSKVKAGRISLPTKIISRVEKALEDFTNQKLAEVEGLKIEVLEFKNGFLHFKGTLPEKVTAR
ncbi:hypothetical protein ACFL0Y_02500, partial [Patescibacteria group bacterium]